MAFKRIVAKSEQDLKTIMDDIMKWFKETKDYKVSFSQETRKFMDPETKKIVEKQIDVINLTDNVNDKRATVKFIPMMEKGEMKIELGGEGETVIAGKISNQMKGRGTLKSYSKDKKVAIKETTLMKKSELKQLIREEILKEYSFKVQQPDGIEGYINSDNIDKVLFQISKFMTGSTNNFSWKKSLTPEDYKNIILLIAKYLNKINPNLNPNIKF